jgi:hypothetical protein
MCRYLGSNPLVGSVLVDTNDRTDIITKMLVLNLKTPEFMYRFLCSPDSKSMAKAYTRIAPVECLYDTQSISLRCTYQDRANIDMQES